MKLRKTKEEDIKYILRIFNQAKEYMKIEEIDQWNEEYPNEQTILEDIRKGISYVLTKKDEVVGTAAIMFDEEKTYKNIYGGTWLTNGDCYVVLHRIAIDSKYKGRGFASKIFDYVEEQAREKAIKSIRVDTHGDNISMQRLIMKNNFKYCGVIYVEDKSQRMAFEKIL